MVSRCSSVRNGATYSKGGRVGASCPPPFNDSEPALKSPPDRTRPSGAELVEVGRDTTLGPPRSSRAQDGPDGSSYRRRP
jgi:hypothetical protein